MIELSLTKDNKKKCSCCDKNIEKETYYFPIEYKSQWGYSNKNVCINCMIRGVIENFIISNTQQRLNKLKEDIDLIIKKRVIEGLK